MRSMRCNQIISCLLVLVVGVLAFGCVAPSASDTQPTATPTQAAITVPTLPPTDDVEEIIRRWRGSMERMRATPSVRISQSIVGVKADGSRVPLPGDLAHAVSMDEVYEKLSYLYSRYRLIAHFSLPESKAGDLIMLYDGEHSYRYRTWTNEVYRPYHDELCKRNSKPNEYCSDNYWEALESIAALYAAYPRGRGNGEVYSYVGRHEADGRSIIELAHKDDAVKGFEQHVYLDEATYLPNRITTYGFGGSFNDLLRQRGYVGYERTFTRFQLGESVSEGDFSLELPTNVITVYDEVGQVYTNTRQVAQEVDFALFEPPGGTEQIKYLDVPY